MLFGNVQFVIAEINMLFKASVVIVMENVFVNTLLLTKWSLLFLANQCSCLFIYINYISRSKD